jgi:regulator of RNase E activity RraA
MGDDEIMRGLRATDTACISDAADTLGLRIQCEGLAPQRAGQVLVGRAYTLRYGPIGPRGGTIGDYIDKVSPGSIVLIDNRGRTDLAVWDDLLSLAAHRNGVGGTVVDGACRTQHRGEDVDYPVFSRGNVMTTGKDRVRVEEGGGTVEIGGVHATAGDWVVGDGDGVVIVPDSMAEAVLEAATRIAAATQAIRDAVRGGSSLQEARRAHAFHSLQSRID